MRLIIKEESVTTDCTVFLGYQTKSTSPHIFEKVLICIERGRCSVYFKEMRLFGNFIFWKRCSFFYQQAELFLSLSQLGEEKEQLFQSLYLHIAFRNLIYVEPLLFGCCINTTFYKNKVVFQILWTIIRLFLWGVAYNLQASCLFSNISRPDENWPLLRITCWGALPKPMMKPLFILRVGSYQCTFYFQT